MLPVVALIVPPDQPPELVLEAAREAEGRGIEELWLWEDCFATSGLAPAAAILGGTQRLRVGIGLMPVPLRAAALTAMEIATLARMFPGRFRPGLGHGVREWMAQAGVAVDSPLTLLREHTEAIIALLRGQEVSRAGRYVQLDRVRLRHPPEVVPGVLVGGRGPRTLAVAGELADGVIVDDAAPKGSPSPARVREVIDQVVQARKAAGREGRPDVVAFLPTADGVTAEQLGVHLRTLGEAGATTVAALAGGVDGPPHAGDQLLCFVDVLAQASDVLAQASDGPRG